MPALLDTQVSVFHGKLDTDAREQPSLGTMLERIQGGQYKQYIEGLRAMREAWGKDAYDQQKGKSHAFTPCCALHTRKQKVPWPDKLISTTGVVYFDIDDVDDPEAVKAELARDPRVLFAFTSPSAHGVKVGVAAEGITGPDDYKKVWAALLAEFQQSYPAIVFKVDDHVKFLNALCYVSYDPALYQNPDAQLYAVPPYQAPAPKAKAPRATSSPRSQTQGTGAGEQARVEDALQVIPADDYDTWLRVGMALHASGEAWARAVWDSWSQRSEKYDTRAQDEKWESFTPDGGVNLATLFHLAQQHGYAPPRPSMTIGQQQSGTPPAQAATPTAAAIAGATAPDQDAGATAVQWGTPGQQVPTPRPDILLNTEMTRIVDETQAALLALPKAPIVYQRARHLAIIARGVKPPKWLHRPHDMPVILDASTARLTELASQAAQFWKYDKRAKKGEEWSAALPPKWVIETLHSRAEWPFPLLEGIVASPTLRPDGSLLDAPGYDATTGLYLDTNGTTFPAISARPTLDDARSALGHLQEAVKDFPFTESWHFSTTIAAMLSLVCRFAVQGNVPLFPIRANTRGSGKSLLADVISIIGTGSAAPRWPQVKEDEEERKRLLTVALAGYPCLHIDNVVRPLGSPALDLALTSSTFSDRLLGKNESRIAPLHMVWLASGNNMQFHGDTARRIVPIDLNPKMERPEERTDFTHTPLLPWIHQERPRLTVAALTIVKAYFTAGCPGQGIPAKGSFEPWSDLIRQAVVWAGEADPGEGWKDLDAESNPEYEQLAELLQAWEVCYPIPQGKARSEAKPLNAVLADIAALKAMDKPPVIPGKPNTPNEYDALQEALGALDQHYDGKMLRSERISYKLRAMQGRMIGSKRLASMGKDRTNKTQWGLETF